MGWVDFQKQYAIPYIKPHLLTDGKKETKKALQMHHTSATVITLGLRVFLRMFSLDSSRSVSNETISCWLLHTWYRHSWLELIAFVRTVPTYYSYSYKKINTYSASYTASQFDSKGIIVIKTCFYYKLWGTMKGLPSKHDWCTCPLGYNSSQHK